MDTGQFWRAAHNAHIVELIDRMLSDWAERRKAAAGAADFLVANSHVDAFQIIREALAGEPLQVPEIDILDMPLGFTVTAVGGKALLSQYLGNETTNLEIAEAFLGRLVQAADQRQSELEHAGEQAGATGGHVIMGDVTYLVHTKDEADAIRATGEISEPIPYQPKDPQARLAHAAAATSAALDRLRAECDLMTESMRRWRETMPTGQWVHDSAKQAAGRYCGRCNRWGMLGYCGGCDIMFYPDGSEDRTWSSKSAADSQPEGFEVADVDDLDKVPRPRLRRDHPGTLLLDPNGHDLRERKGLTYPLGEVERRGFGEANPETLNPATGEWESKDG
jgi:hypothetical protein